MIREGLLSRGGISYGDCYIDDTMIMGQALIDAYSLESKTAVYPRVLISKKTIECFHFQDKNMLVDIDGEYYADYVRILMRKDIPNQFIPPMYDFVNQNIEKYKDNPDVLRKYKWLKDKMDQY